MKYGAIYSNGSAHDLEVPHLIFKRIQCEQTSEEKIPLLAQVLEIQGGWLILNLEGLLTERYS